MQPPSHNDTPPPIQFSNQPQYQQLQPHMMLCPVQFLYEPQIMVPPDEQVVPPAQTQTFQNQGFLLNVQNTPPWIQNRPNMVYMPQVQMGNMQPYIHQHMVQNPMYNYQYQPMIMHDQIRHIVPYMNHMQSPQMVQNVVQSPQSVAQNVIQNQPSVPNSPNLMTTQNVIQSPMRMQMEQKRQSPMLSHILHNNMAKQTMVTPSQHAEFASPMQIIRPHFQNTRPQMIIVNPIGPTHTCTHNQKETPSAAFEKPKTEVPIQVKKQIPDGRSVKTVFKLSATALVRPNEYVQNIAPVDEAHPRVYPKPVVKPASNRDPQTNYKRKIREIAEQNTRDESEALMFKRNCLINKKEATNNNNAMKPALNMPPLNALEAQNMNSGLIVSERPMIEQNGTDRVNDKLLRNTVYVQARGIVNELPKVEMQNASTSMADHQNTSITKVKHRVPTENETESRDSLPDVSVNISIVENKGENVGDKSCQNDNAIPETVLMIGSMAQNELKVTQVSPNNEANAVINDHFIMTIPLTEAEQRYLQVTRDNLQTTTQLSNTESDDAKLRKILKMARFRQPDDQIKTNKTVTLNSSKTTILFNNNESDDTKNLILPKVNQFLHSDDADGTMTRHNSKMTKIIQSSNADNKTRTQKQPDTPDIPERATTQTYVAPQLKVSRKNPFLLTHVVEGHILQESNVPFPVQKPTLTRRNTNQILIDYAGPSTSKRNKSSNRRQTESSTSRPTEPSTSKQAESSTIRQSEPSTSSQNEPSTYRLAEPSNNRQAEPSTSRKTKPSNSRQNKQSIPLANELSTNHANIGPVDTETSDEEMELAIDEATEKDAQTNIKNVAETELAGPVSGIVERNEEDPFEILSLAAVKLWTISDLASHLMDHENWQDTAQKLREEEIDGESLLLVNKDQLIQIGISEEHAEVLSAFLARA